MFKNFKLDELIILHHYKYETRFIIDMKYISPFIKVRNITTTLK